MGKAAKTRRSEQRKGQKRAAKAQKQALYQSYQKSGSNKKKKGNSAGNGGVSTSKHVIAFCGNHGCGNCMPHLAAPKMNDSNDPRVRFRTIADMKKEMENPSKNKHIGTTFDSLFEELGEVNPLWLSSTEETFFHRNPATGLPE
jgi:hypothetical protein